VNVISVGMDLIDCARVARVLERHGEHFLRRILTPAEVEESARRHNSVSHVAGRFAAKEAVLKVLGTGWRGRIAWTDIGVANDALGKPEVRLSGACAERAAELGIARILLTITHTRAYAAATALGVREPRAGGGG
jgi:holo-[acyl-carrier protein] synthase